MRVCSDCLYPFAGESCGNPACFQVNPEAHAIHKARREGEDAERAERDRVRRWAESNGYSAA